MSSLDHKEKLGGHHLDQHTYSEVNIYISHHYHAVDFTTMTMIAYNGQVEQAIFALPNGP